MYRKSKPDHTNSRPVSQKPRTESDTRFDTREVVASGSLLGTLPLCSEVARPFLWESSLPSHSTREEPSCPNTQQGFFTCVFDSIRLCGDVRFGLELDNYVLITCHNISPLSAILPAGLVLKEHMEAVAKHLIYKTCLYA